MAIFQNTVVNKYLKSQEAQVLSEKWTLFKSHFLDPAKQDNIRNAKEEQYQEGFLRDLFVNVFGYTLNPDTNFNLTTELKNVKDSKKADGGIIIGGEVFGVIELKGTNTTDLAKVEAQAFGYKNNQTGCVYVITSNFEKLRFYIDNATEHIEFNLFKLTEEDFKLLYLCVAFENIKKHIPKKLKEESLSQEEEITEQLYKDYSLFKRELFQDLTKQNPQFEPLELFKKSQKLLDRFLFLFFAEDRILLPPNSVRLILKEWKQLKDLDAYTPLYDRYKKFFSYLDLGFKGNENKDDIFAYNGGLFKPDEILDSILIDDSLLYQHTLKLADYDFASKVDVNILGHIFENSLNELDEVKAQLEGKAIDKSATKRKKDGVFYTPKYITKYMVENTVGKLCDEKRNELGIGFVVPDKTFITKSKKPKLTTQGKDYSKKLNEYRVWLLDLKICDPACGSGAFLNQALEFLISEHNLLEAYVLDLQKLITGEGVQFTTGLRDITDEILENNLFGVDINEESVEIAKLSLWLRTAQPNRKLNNLNNNIKCGNSLIDDITVAGDKAFNWGTEFPEVFGKGGFDVVIGNPPYGASLDGKDWLKTRYKETSFGNIDSYKYFVQLGSELARNDGVLGYIMPDSYLQKEYFKDLRVFTSNNFGIITNIKMGDDVFEEVNLPTAIIILNNKGTKASDYRFLDLSIISKTNKSNSLVDNTKFITDKPKVEETFVVIRSIIKSNNTVPLIDVYDQVMGVKTYQKGKGKPKQTNHEKNEDVFVSNKLDDEFNYPYVSQGINRYSYQTQNEFISYGEWLAEPRKKEYFDNPKVIIREIINPRIFATYIEEPAVVKNIAAVIIQKDELYPIKFLLGLINSKLLTHYVNEQSPKSSNKSYPSFNSRLLKQLPIVKCNDEDKSKLMIKVDFMLEETEKLIINNTKFIKYLQSKFTIEKASKKLQNWHKLEFGDFIKELNKAIKKAGVEKLTKSDEIEWMDVFEAKKAEVQSLQAQITKTDKEIDAMVYELYDLTDEEIAIVENS